MVSPEDLLRATADIPAPALVIDQTALTANADDLVRRAAGRPIRIATKSVRVRGLIDQVLARPGFAGLMTYSLAESLWLVEHGARDILLAYPSVDAAALRRLAADEAACSAITLMVDDPAHLERFRHVIGAAHPPLRVCLDVDASLRIGPAHLGVRRSPVHTLAQARRAAQAIADAPGANLVGVMFYDAQIAGLPDRSPLIRAVKRRSADELRERRGAIVEALRPIADLQIVNGGGTGSLHLLHDDPALTELTAGSGLFAPTLFDGYDDFSPQPAAFMALDVVRRPARRVATCFSGGVIASGPPGTDRLPRPVHPTGLSLMGTEGAGEVQTPVRGRAAAGLRVGDRVLFRTAKAGEPAERFTAAHVVDHHGSVRTYLTYRGEGQSFG